jgi:hypothetical protein
VKGFADYDCRLGLAPVPRKELFVVVFVLRAPRYRRSWAEALSTSREVTIFGLGQ